MSRAEPADSPGRVAHTDLDAASPDCLLDSPSLACALVSVPRGAGVSASGGACDSGVPSEARGQSASAPRRTYPSAAKALPLASVASPWASPRGDSACLHEEARSSDVQAHGRNKPKSSGAAPSRDAGAAHAAAKSGCASHPITGQLSDDSAAQPDTGDAAEPAADATNRALAADAAAQQHLTPDVRSANAADTNGHALAADAVAHWPQHQLLTPNFLNAACGDAALDLGLLTDEHESARSAPFYSDARPQLHAVPRLPLSAVIGDGAAAAALEAAGMSDVHGLGGSPVWALEEPAQVPVLRSRVQQRDVQGASVGQRVGLPQQERTPAWARAGAAGAADDHTSPSVLDAIADHADVACVEPLAAHTKPQPQHGLPSVWDWKVGSSPGLDPLPHSEHMPHGAQRSAMMESQALAVEATRNNPVAAKPACKPRSRGRGRGAKGKSKAAAAAEVQAPGALRKPPANRRAAPPPFKASQGLPAPFLTPEDLARTSATPPPDHAAHGANTLCPPLVCAVAAQAAGPQVLAARLAGLDGPGIATKCDAARARIVSRNLASHFRHADDTAVDAGLFGLVGDANGTLDMSAATDLTSPRFAGEKAKAYEDSPGGEHDRDIKSPRVHAAC